MRIKGLLMGACGVLSLLAAANSASAYGVIADPTNAFQVGIGDNGELYDGNSGIGIQRVSDGYDPLAPGTPRDSWGVATSLGSAYGDQFYAGVQNVTATNIALGANGGVAASTTSVGVNLTQTYSFAAPNIVKIVETITNTSGSTLAGALFQRDVDWDVNPTAFNENTVGPFGAGNSAVVDSSYYGFESPDPAAPYALSCFVGCNTVGDLGGGIKIAIPTLAAGGSYTFDYYYGISETGETLDGLVSEATGLGADYIIGTQSSENGLYGSGLGIDSAFIGFGPASVPETATWVMMILGVGAIGAAGRMRRGRIATAVA